MDELTATEIALVERLRARHELNKREDAARLRRIKAAYEARCRAWGHDPYPPEGEAESDTGWLILQCQTLAAYTDHLLERLAAAERDR